MFLSQVDHSQSFPEAYFTPGESNQALISFFKRQSQNYPPALCSIPGASGNNWDLGMKTKWKKRRVLLQGTKVKPQNWNQYMFKEITSKWNVTSVSLILALAFIKTTMQPPTQKSLHINIQSRFICNNQNLETVQMSFNTWMIEQIPIHPYNGILHFIGLLGLTE